MSQQMNDDIKAMQVVVIALMAGLFSFLLIALFLTQSGGGFIGEDAGFMNTMLIVLLSMSAVILPVAFVLFKKRMKEVVELEGIQNKIIAYRSALIVRAAMFEGIGFFSLVCLLFFGHYIFAIISFAILILFAILFPTKKNITKDMNVKAE